jgi:hypothetical protein
MGAQGGLPEPRIHELVDIDGDGASEVVVDEAAGASTQFVGAFAISDGALERLRPTGNEGGTLEAEGLFAYGGSVGHIDGVGCASGEIVVSGAVPGDAPGDLAHQIYRVDRRFYEIDGSTLKLDRTEKLRLPANRLEGLPEFSLGPFGNC